MPGRAPKMRGGLMRGDSGAGGVRIPSCSPFGTIGTSLVPAVTSNFASIHAAMSFATPSPVSLSSRPTVFAPFRSAFSSTALSPKLRTGELATGLPSARTLNWTVPARAAG